MRINSWNLPWAVLLILKFLCCFMCWCFVSPPPRPGSHCHIFTGIKHVNILMTSGLTALMTFYYIPQSFPCIHCMSLERHGCSLQSDACRHKKLQSGNFSFHLRTHIFVPQLTLSSDITWSNLSGFARLPLEPQKSLFNLFSLALPMSPKSTLMCKTSPR